MTALFEISHEDWQKEAVKRYGTDHNTWKFRCPSCLNIMTPKMYHDFGITSGMPKESVQNMMAFSCVGRLMDKPQEMLVNGKGFCNYAGAGLFRLNPILVKFPEGEERRFFDFANDPLVKPAVLSQSDYPALEQFKTKKRQPRHTDNKIQIFEPDQVVMDINLKQEDWIVLSVSNGWAKVCKYGQPHMAAFQKTISCRTLEERSNSPSTRAKFVLKEKA
jgi:hypothetical protein